MRHVLLIIATITLVTATAIGLGGCATEKSVTEPPETTPALASKADVDAYDRNRILADRRAALQDTESSKIAACRGYFEDLYKRGVVDGLTYELASIHLKNIRRTRTEDEKRRYEEGHLKGFCTAAGLVHAFNSARPVERYRMSYGVDGPAIARMEDMYAVSPKKCADRLRDLRTAGAVGEVTFSLMASELAETSQAPGDRYMHVGFIHGYCTAISNLWQGLVL